MKNSILPIFILIETRSEILEKWRWFDLQLVTEISEDFAAFFFSVSSFIYPKDGDSKFLQNVSDERPIKPQ